MPCFHDLILVNQLQSNENDRGNDESSLVFSKLKFVYSIYIQTREKIFSYN